MEFNMSEKKNNDVIIVQKLSDSELSDIIIDGIETGICSWGLLCNDGKEFHSYYYNGHSPKPEYKDWALSEKIADWVLNQGKDFWIEDIEKVEKAKFPLNKERLIKGIEMNAKERPWDADLDNADAITTDCIIQYAIFDNIIFG